MEVIFDLQCSILPFLFRVFILVHLSWLCPCLLRHEEKAPLPPKKIKRLFVWTFPFRSEPLPLPVPCSTRTPLSLSVFLSTASPPPDLPLALFLSLSLLYETQCLSVCLPWGKTQA